MQILRGNHVPSRPRTRMLCLVSLRMAGAGSLARAGSAIIDMLLPVAVGRKEPFLRVALTAPRHWDGRVTRIRCSERSQHLFAMRAVIASE